MIKYKKDTNNIVTLTLDMNNQYSNILNHNIYSFFKPVLAHLQKEKSQHQLNGIIITSAKKNFLEGDDLGFVQNQFSAQEIFRQARTLSQFFRELEQPGVPVVAAINGDALGIGFELALACHHRIVVDDSSIRVGNTEVSVGLMPGNGGVTRLLWLLGLEKAYHILTSGKRYRPGEALKEGIIDEVAQDNKSMMESAKRWLLSFPEGRRPWDQEGMSIPGGNANSPAIAKAVQRLSAELAQSSYGNFPAPLAILNTLVEGSKVDFDIANRIENRNYAELAVRPETKNMIKTLLYDFNAIKKGSNRPKGFGKFRPRQVGVIGAGRMGSGIAFNCVRRGLKVILKDVSKPIAQLGKQYTGKQLDKMVEMDTISQKEKDELFSRVVPTANPQDFDSCDLIIEAVYENEMVKVKALKEAEQYLDEYAIFATNTLSIPITRLAKGSYRPENYVGLHFFYPVEKVPLVEIVRGKKTSDETIARAFDFVRALGKVPIIVKDAWGFYVARVQNTYILEGITLLQEGYPPALIENVGLQLGMPMGALAFADNLSLKMVLKYEGQAAEHYGSQYEPHPAVTALSVMVNDLSRTGRTQKAGFYDYAKDKKQLWNGLQEHFPTTKKELNLQVIRERMIFAQIIEAVWCLQEKVITSAAEANLGSIFGWGFPAFTGGVFQYINNYGLDNFINRCEDFKDEYGPRFRVPRLLKKKLEQGELLF